MATKVVFTPFLEADGKWTVGYSAQFSRVRGAIGFGDTHESFHYAVASAALNLGKEYASPLSAEKNEIEIKHIHDGKPDKPGD